MLGQNSKNGRAGGPSGFAVIGKMLASAFNVDDVRPNVMIGLRMPRFSRFDEVRHVIFR
jgi:hypothetical protein